MKRLLSLVAALICASASAATLNPVQLLNPTGSTVGQAVVSTGPSTAPAWGNVTATALAAQAANTVVANTTGLSASPTAVAMPGCSSSTSALQYTSGTGFTCFAGSAPLASPAFTGAATFATRPTFNGNTPYDTGNLTIANYAPLASPTFTGTVTLPNISASGTITGISGRLLAVQTFTAGGTYTPTTGANRALVELVGGGGGGGGTPITSASQNAIGQAGNAGAYAQVWIPSGLASQTVTVGAAGAAGATGAAGGNGGTTSFGTLASCTGGNGGGAGVAVSVFPAFTTYNLTAATCSGTATFLKKVPGALATAGLLLAGASFIPGSGGSTPFGVGAQWLGGTTGIAATGFGAGGLGAGAGASAAALGGGAGTGGFVVVYEFQ